ncbi:hypothetical protein FOMG_18157 [Fusarium oxysporum f. sp. melonis 26406]|uniref:Metallo-beta-lactamase domain-containing protein n=1 Tax=Fusarium oxysporum f. sp. melonis 26406 TaxID=1089452 RepID=W9ZVS2_FUSOX|nr:hypothetical protein FOMG_18157 [Fusarium oxysporum f. sp. melonis 26406]
MNTRQLLKFMLTLASTVSVTPLHHASSSPQELIGEALDALGGVGPIGELKGLTYEAPRIFRSRSLMQSYDMSRADTFVSISGSQNISFRLDQGFLEQRIDRRATPSSYWSWGNNDLTPLEFSLVVNEGKDGFACYVQGNDQIFLPPGLTSGYTDAALTYHLVLQAQMLSPHLLYHMKDTKSISATTVEINGIEFTAVRDPSRELTVIFDPKTSLPYIIRTIEDHPIYGESTKDLYLSSYKVVQGIKFAHTVQTIYNSTTQGLNAVLEDFIIDKVILNPSFPSKFFDGISEDRSLAPKSAPKKIPGISAGLMTEYNSNMLGTALKNATIENLEVETPVSDLPQVHWVIVDDDNDLGVKQMAIEFEHEVIILDAPPQWTKAVMQWVAKNLKKPVTYVAPSHHHRDHAGGIDKYVEAGVKLIVPEVAVDLWSSIPGAKFVTFNQTHPYVHRDGKIQAWFNWEDQATHSADWSYVTVTKRCPTAKSPIVAFQADAW